MRIVGGALKGRRFGRRAGEGTRPTADRVREAIGSILEARGAIEGRVVLDLFAGTGALAFEALSRGALRATLVERDRRMARAIEDSARELGLSERCSIVVADALDPGIERRLAGPYDLVFVDPPYAEVAPVTAQLEAIADRVFAAEAIVVREHATRAPPPLLRRLDVVGAYRYGDTSVVLLSREDACDDRAEP